MSSPVGPNHSRLKRPRDFDLPPSHLKYSERLLDYAPTCSAALGPWLDALPDHQLSAVWKPVVMERIVLGDCNGADALSILQAVDRRFVKVSIHGRDSSSTRGDADPHRAA